MISLFLIPDEKKPVFALDIIIAIKFMLPVACRIGEMQHPKN